MDPAYVELSESTGGQLFLFQKGEAAHASLVMAASYTHPATVLRTIGHLNGSRDFEFPVDSTIASLLVLGSLQCRNAILVFRPNGSELTGTNAALSVDLQAGRILRIDGPEPGRWRVRLTGTGLFVLSVLAKADVSLAGVSFSSNDDPSNGEASQRSRAPIFGVRQDVEIRVSGHAAEIKVQLVDAAEDRISDMQPMQPAGEGTWRASVTPQAPRFRILVTGTDASAWPFQRIYPILLRAVQPR